ncbi:MAG: hypothetical protein B1H03_00450 [Planctomycetales bacterium 4484_113]|nr:MAG: hypothetical protein B1H03_00450 [Planctomycetales bacterium 4484_113]
MVEVPQKLVKITLDGRELSVPEGIYLLEAARLAGIEIPALCNHAWLQPLGACRMCLVRIEGVDKLQTACSTQVRDGMVVITESDEIKRAREQMLEFHLLNHPLECPVCDKGGECLLQDLTERHGLFTSRYVEEKLAGEDSLLNPFLRISYKRCIMCQRCVRYCEEISGDHLAVVRDRGAWSEITASRSFSEVPSRFSGNLIELCPVGAITSIPFRFHGRAWELTKTRTVCNQCAVGCNVELHTRLGKLMRIVPASEPGVDAQLDNGHLCDRGRFAYGWVQSSERLHRPLIKRDGEFAPATWDEAEKLVAEKLTRAIDEYGGDAVAVLAGNSLTNEEYMALRIIAHRHVGTTNFFLGEDLFDISRYPLLLLHSLFFDSASLAETMNGDLIVLVGCDILEEAPVLGLRLEEAVRKGTTLVSFASYATESERRASVRARYPAGRFVDAVEELIVDVASPSNDGKYAALARSLLAADRVSLIYGQELLWHPRASEHVLALMKLKYAVKSKREAEGKPMSHFALNPIFRGANSIGAVVFNHLELLTGRSEEIRDKVRASMKSILQKAAEGKVKVLYLVGINPLMTFPDRKLVQDAVAGADFVVAQDHFLHETSREADVVLPTAPWPFKGGTFLNFEWRLQKLNPVELVDDTPTDLELWNRLLIAMRRGSHSTEPRSVFDEIARVTPPLSHLTYDSIPPHGSVLDFTLPPEGLADIGERVAGLRLEAGRCEPREEYPFVLLPKTYLFRNSPRLRCTSWMEPVRPSSWVQMHPADSKRLNLEEEQPVRVESPHGSIDLELRLSKDITPGSVLVNNYSPEQPVNRLLGVDDDIFAVRVVPR